MRCRACGSTEYFAKVGGAGHTNTVTDFGNGKGGPSEQHTGMTNAGSLSISNDGGASRFFKYMR